MDTQSTAQRTLPSRYTVRYSSTRNKIFVILRECVAYKNVCVTHLVVVNPVVFLPNVVPALLKKHQRSTTKNMIIIIVTIIISQREQVEETVEMQLCKGKQSKPSGREDIRHHLPTLSILQPLCLNCIVVASHSHSPTCTVTLSATQHSICSPFSANQFAL